MLINTLKLHFSLPRKFFPPFCTYYVSPWPRPSPSSLFCVFLGCDTSVCIILKLTHKYIMKFIYVPVLSTLPYTLTFFFFQIHTYSTLTHLLISMCIHKHTCCRKGDPIQGPKVGFCLTLGKEMSEETHELTKQETIGKGCPGGEPQCISGQGGWFQSGDSANVPIPTVF